MGPDGVDDGSDLVVGHAVAKARHSVAPLQHHRSDIGGRGDLRIVGQRRIDARALGALAMGHVATLAGRAVEGCTVGLDETWSIRHFRRHGIAGARGWYRRSSQADGAPHQGAGETKVDRPHWHAVLVELMRLSVAGFDARMQTLHGVERRQHGTLLPGRQIRGMLASQRQAAVDLAEVLVVRVAGLLRPPAVTAVGPGNAVPTDRDAVLELLRILRMDLCALAKDLAQT